MSDLASLFAIIRGRVQGVFFRDFVAQHARALDLTGYVRNLPDGRSVEVRAEGERERLEELLRRLKVGPQEARVDHVEVEWLPSPSGFDHFEVRL